jgi:hypothetical protein
MLHVPVLLQFWWSPSEWLQITEARVVPSGQFKWDSAEASSEKLDAIATYLQVVTVRKISHMDIQSCRCFVGIGIMDEQRLELVRELDNAIGSVVKIGLLKLGGKNRRFTADNWEVFGSHGGSCRKATR